MFASDTVHGVCKASGQSIYILAAHSRWAWVGLDALLCQIADPCCVARHVCELRCVHWFRVSVYARAARQRVTVVLCGGGGGLSLLLSRRVRAVRVFAALPRAGIASQSPLAAARRARAAALP